MNEGLKNSVQDKGRHTAWLWSAKVTVPICNSTFQSSNLSSNTLGCFPCMCACVMWLCEFSDCFPDDRQGDTNITAHPHKNAPTLIDSPFQLWVCSDGPPSVSGSLLPAQWSSKDDDTTIIICWCQILFYFFLFLICLFSGLILSILHSQYLCLDAIFVKVTGIQSVTFIFIYFFKLFFKLFYDFFYPPHIH